MKPVRLTNRKIDSLKYRGKKTRGGGWTRCILWDADLTGFAVRIFPSGRKRFVLRWREPVIKPNRRDFFKTIGKGGVLSLVEAKKQARSFLKEIQRQRYSLPEGDK